MKLIDRYVTSQVILTGVFAVAVLSLVLVLGKVFKELLDRLIATDAPLDLILSVFAYILPFSLTFTIPWGFLTTVLLVFGRMSAENELIALRSTGVSIGRVTAPVFIIAVICSAICLWINVDVAPRAQQRMNDAVYEMATSNPLAMFGDDKVITEFKGKKIYVGRNEGAQLFNLLVYEMNDDNIPMRIVHAKRGELEVDSEKNQLLLHIYDARYEARDEQEPENLTKIRQATMQKSTLPISLDELYERNKKNKRSGSMTVRELTRRLREQKLASSEDVDPKEAAEQRSSALTEVNKRFSFAFATLAFAIIGVPLAITAHRKETSIGFLFSLIVAFAYFFFIIIADTVRSNPAAYPQLLVWLPNVLFIGIGSVMFRRMVTR
ncbi:MAG: LptF/LptG family permease [Chthoniobacteraceae bacterium]